MYRSQNIFWRHYNKKAEPGSVFVRVFGIGQSPLKPCWCKANDPESAVTQAKDLYNTLAVKPEWNGDGNLAILVIPEGIDIYYAEGKIASQVGNYKVFINEGDEKKSQNYKFVFQGGGTQTNILAKNVSEGCGPFANLSQTTLWEKVMIVFCNDEMINPSSIISQQNEQK